MIKLFLSETLPAWDLLAQVLREEYCLPALPELSRREMGKPYFPGHPELHFNLSHSGTFALCGVGDEPLGVDIEVVRPRRSGLPRYALTAGECAAFTAQGGGWGEFCALWTRREAWCKYTGAGIARVRGQDIPAGLVLRSFSGQSWRAAACAAGPVGALCQR